MRQPECLTPLIDQGIIQEVVRPLMSGKEAQIYLVVSDDELRVAKVYKAAQNRSFRQRVEYTEGRAVRNTRTQRALNKHSRYGRAQDEAAWRLAEVEIIHRLRAAGVWVPEPYFFGDGILVMELITDANGEPAPRLADVALDGEDTGAVFATLLSEVVKMLCAGVVHGDLSEFNVLLGQDGPVLIDFPQAVDPAHNQNARQLLIRDVDNLNRFLVRTMPGKRKLPYGQELWNLYTRSELTPETQLTGRYKPSKKKADTSAVLYEVKAAADEAERRRDVHGQRPGRRRRRGRRPRPDQQTARAEAKAASPKKTAGGGDKPGNQGNGPGRRRRPGRRRTPDQQTAPAEAKAASPKKTAGGGDKPGNQGNGPGRRRRPGRRRTPDQQTAPAGAETARPKRGVPPAATPRSGTGEGGKPDLKTKQKTRRRRRRRGRRASGSGRAGA